MKNRKDGTYNARAFCELGQNAIERAQALHDIKTLLESYTNAEDERAPYSAVYDLLLLTYMNYRRAVLALRRANHALDEHRLGMIRKDDNTMWHYEENMRFAVNSEVNNAQH